MGAVRREITVGQIIRRYDPFAKENYSDGEYTTMAAAWHVLDACSGHLRIRRFGPNRLREVRKAMISKGWNRVYINRQVLRLIAIFRWASANEIVSERMSERLRTIEPLKRKRTIAPEPCPVMAANLAAVAAIKPHLSRQLQAVIDLQLLTGARPGELLPLRPMDIDRSEKIWRNRLTEHKTEHHGRDRTIYFGPQAQAVLLPWLMRPEEAELFAPAEAEDERIKNRTAHRSTPAGQGHVAQGRRKAVGNFYTTHSYRRAIDRACAKAGVPVWQPNQLRHRAATDIRRQFGLVAASLVLGHASAALTDAVYAERDQAEVEKIMQSRG